MRMVEFLKTAKFGDKRYPKGAVLKTEDSFPEDIEYELENGTKLLRELAVEKKPEPPAKPVAKAKAEPEAPPEGETKKAPEKKTKTSKPAASKKKASSLKRK